MNALIHDKADSLRDLCRKHCVRALYLFGSGARDDFDPARSDFDFLVEFEPGSRGGGFNDVYFKLIDDLEQLFGRKIDLVERHVIERSENYIRRKAILSSLQPIYAAA